MPYTHTDVQAAGKAKILLMAPSKAGKSCCAVNTSPGPVFVINADPDGLVPPAKLGGKFDAEDVYDIAALEGVLRYLDQEQKGKHPYRTIVLDTVTMLAQHLEIGLKKRGLQGWDVFRELKEKLLGSTMRLLNYDAHVIIVAHALDTTSDSGSLGTIPAISGQSKTFIPALVQDYLWLEVTTSKDSKPKREFLLSPQGNWKHGCRSIQHEDRMEANITKFLQKAGMKP